MIKLIAAFILAFPIFANANSLSGESGGGSVANQANATLKGNTFNGPNQLVNLLLNGKLPVLDGSNLYNVGGGGSSTGTANTVAFYDNSGNLTSSLSLTFDGTTLGASIFGAPPGDNTLTIRSNDTAGDNHGDILIKGGNTDQGGQAANIVIEAGDTDPTNTHGGNGPAGNLTMRGGSEKNSDRGTIAITGATQFAPGHAGDINIKAANPNGGGSPHTPSVVNIEAGTGENIYLNSPVVGGAATFSGSSIFGNITQINTVPYNWTGSQGNAFEVLTNDGSGNLYWAQPVAATTDTQVLYNSAGIISGSSNMTFDGTNLFLQGNLARINTVDYVWTTSQGAANTLLTNDGAGNLTWTPAFVGGSNTQVLYNSGGTETGSANLVFDGTTLTPAALAVTGNINSINTVPYTFPNTQGAQNTVLQNDGAGTLNWVSTDTFAVSTFSMIPSWHKYNYDFTSFSSASTATYQTIVTIPPGAVIHAAKIKQNIRINTGGTYYTLSIGVIGDDEKYASAYDLTPATGPLVYQLSEDFNAENSDLPSPILGFVKSDDVTSNTASGNFDVWLLISVPQDETPGVF